MSKKEKPYLLTQKLAAEIVARKKIRPDAPNTMPGDPGNGHVLVLDDEHQKFGGHVYTRRIIKKKDDSFAVRYKYNADKRTFLLHAEVWAFHNGEPPKGFLIHHEHRQPDGKFDSDENNIEWLFLMKRSEHSYYHNIAQPCFERVCQNPKCGKTFFTTNYRAMYCCEQCGRETRADARLFENKFITPEIAKHLEEAMRVASDFFIDAGDNGYGGKLETRCCYFCHRTFTTNADRPALMCGRPDCKGRDLVKSLSRMQKSVGKRIAERNNRLRAFFNKEFGELDAYADEDGVAWFVGKQAAEMLGYINTRKAIRDHVEEADKREERRVPPSGKGGVQTMIMINQFGFNDLIMHSELPAAKRIQHWITHDVMPKLLVQGYYSFVEQPSVLTDYFVDEELLMLLLFRERRSKDLRALATLNLLSDEEWRLISQLIEFFADKHHEQEPLTLEAKPEQD